MVIEYIRYNVSPERAEEFADAYRRAGEVLATDQHCLGYEVTRGAEEPHHWIVRISWDSIEGHEGGFRKAPHFGEFFSAVRPFFDDIEEMKHYEVQFTS